MTSVVLTVRRLLKQPFVTTLVIFSLALGIGANATCFGLIDALLRPLPIQNPSELVRVSTVSPTGQIGDDRLLLSMFVRLRETVACFSSLFIWNDDALRNLQVGDDRFLGEVDEVSGEFFYAIGGRPLIGRWLTSTDVDLDNGHSSQVAVLGYTCWVARYHSDPHVVGKKITVDGIPLTIIGVTQKNFPEIDIDVSSDAYVPIGFDHSPDAHAWYNVSGRLKPGTTILRATAELQAVWPNVLSGTISPQLSSQAESAYLARKVRLSSQAAGDSSLRERYLRPLVVLMSLSAVVLLVTCLNLISILLARTAVRLPEFQIRMALGAPRFHVASLVVLEALVLSGAGSLIGTIFAFFASQYVVDLFWTGFVLPGVRFSFDRRVLLFMIGIAVLTATISSAMAANRAVSTNISPVSAQIAGISRMGKRTGASLIFGQVLFTFLLVSVAFRIAGMLHSLKAADLGYQRTNILTLTLFQQSKSATPPSRAYYLALANDLSKLPGVDSVSFSQSTPAFNYEFSHSVSSSTNSAHALSDAVAPGFFPLLKIPLIEGRDFSWNDDYDSPKVTIISQALALDLFSRDNPLGQSVVFDVGDQAKRVTVVGVAGDANLWRPGTEHPLALYFPLAQTCATCSPLALIRTVTEPMALAQSSERTVKSLGYQFPIRMQSVEQRFEKLLSVEIISSWLSVLYALFALLLAALGLFGLIAYSVETRYREIGVRLAVGATRESVLLLILGEVLSSVLLALASGMPIAWFGLRVVSMRYAIRSDGFVYTVLEAAALVLVVCLLSVVLPAWRTLQINPAEALRNE